MKSTDNKLETILMRSLLHILDDGLGIIVDDEDGKRFIVHRSDKDGIRNLGIAPAGDFGPEISSLPIGTYVMTTQKPQEVLQMYH